LRSVVIADAGPLIALSRIDALDLLRGLFGQVLVTEEVRDEALPAADYPGKALIAKAFEAGWLACPGPFETSWQPTNPGLDAGERSAIAAALKMPGCLLVIDDRAGRAEAKSHHRRHHRHRGGDRPGQAAGLDPGGASGSGTLAAGGVFHSPEDYRGGVARRGRVIRRSASADFSKFRHSGESRNPDVSCGNAGSRPGGRPTFLFAQERRQRSAPRLPGPMAEGSPESRPFARHNANKLALRNPALTPRRGRPAGPVAKLAVMFQ
jgi:predicted nucleic acid-binding protein